MDSVILRRVPSQFEADRLRDENLLLERRREIYDKIPEIRTIEADLRTTAAKISRAAFSDGSDPRVKLQAIKSHNDALIERRSLLLRQNGYPEDYLAIRYRCPLCSDLGYIGAQPCKCLVAAYAREQAKELSSMLNLSEYNFDKYTDRYFSPVPDPKYRVSPADNMEMIYDRCVEFAEGFGKHHLNFLFYGASGLGKTFLSGCIARAVGDRGFSVVYDTAINIAASYSRVRFDHAGEEDTRRMRRAKLCDLLIIDDLGTEMASAVVTEGIYALINHRLTERRSTIISTNLTPEQIASRYSQQIASRLNGEYEHMRFFGEDIRLIKKRERGAL